MKDEIGYDLFLRISSKKRKIRTLVSRLSVINFGGKEMSKALDLHKELQGKIETTLKASLDSVADLSLVYSPGVADPCMAIYDDEQTVYDYTWKGNTIVVVSDGTAVLGLGDIGPKAALPVMEGKAALLKRFANVNAVPLVLDTKDPEAIIAICKAIAPGFGGINLEDISAPRCIEIEQRLQDELDIPVFHDDQHGTAIVTLAALMNALKLVGKKAEDVRVVISGTGAAGSAIIRLLTEYGIKTILPFDKDGLVSTQTAQNDHQHMVANLCKCNAASMSLADAFKGSDVFIGVSAPNIVTKTMVQSMNEQAIVFAMANPDSEIPYDQAIAAGAAVVGTGRSDYPNQINNVLVFPGLFKGLLAIRAKNVPTEIKLVCAKAIAATVSDDMLSATHIVPSVFDENFAEIVASAVITEVEALRAKGMDI